MTRHAFNACLLLAGVLVSIAHAATPGNGAVGTLQLPDSVKLTLVPVPDDGKPDDNKRTTWALDYTGKAGPERAALYQVCGPHIDKVSTTDRGIETLAIAGTIAGGYRISEQGRWVELDSQRTYRIDGIRGKNVLISQWLVPAGDALASIRFERVADAPIERDMLQAIEHMQFNCSLAAARAVEG